MKVLDIVDKNNRPGALRFLDATDDRLVAPAIEAVRQWPPVPAQLTGGVTGSC
jgi:hypothetical protein